MQTFWLQRQVRALSMDLQAFETSSSTSARYFMAISAMTSEGYAVRLRCYIVGLNHPWCTSNRTSTLLEYIWIMSICLNSTEGWIQQVASRGLLGGLVVQMNPHFEPPLRSVGLIIHDPHNRVLTAARGKEQNTLLHTKLLNQKVAWHLKSFALARSNQISATILWFLDILCLSFWSMIIGSNHKSAN